MHQKHSTQHCTQSLHVPQTLLGPHQQVHHCVYIITIIITHCLECWSYFHHNLSDIYKAARKFHTMITCTWSVPTVYYSYNYIAACQIVFSTAWLP